MSISFNPGSNLNIDPNPLSGGGLLSGLGKSNGQSGVKTDLEREKPHANQLSGAEAQVALAAIFNAPIQGSQSLESVIKASINQIV